MDSMDWFTDYQHFLKLFPGYLYIMQFYDTLKSYCVYVGLGYQDHLPA